MLSFHPFIFLFLVIALITYTVTVQQNSSHATFLLENVWGSLLPTQ